MTTNTDKPAAQDIKDVEWFSRWIRNNYQDHQSIASLCEAMTEAAYKRRAILLTAGRVQQAEPEDMDELLRQERDRRKRWLNKLLNDFAKACAFGDDNVARMVAANEIHELFNLAAPAERAPAPAAPEGFALVSIEQLATWKGMANQTAACSIKKERYAVGSLLKTEIADVIADPLNIAAELAPTAQEASKPVQADCAGGSPCTDCPDKKLCRRGCIRQPEFISREYHDRWDREALATQPPREEAMFLTITLENVNEGTQWVATSNHSRRIVVGQQSAHEALRLALIDAGAAPNNRLEVEQKSTSPDEQERLGKARHLLCNTPLISPSEVVAKLLATKQAEAASDADIFEKARAAGMFGFEDRFSKPLLRFARSLLATQPPAIPAAPAVQASGEWEALLIETRDKAASLLRHYGGQPKTADKLRELIEDCDREIDQRRAALASPPAGGEKP